MSGRYSQHTSVARLSEIFRARIVHGCDVVKPRYNVAPTTACLVVRMADVGRVIEPMRWGLIPHWSRQPVSKFSAINARSEDAADTAMYRGPMRYRRCLVPVDGYYEWARSTNGAGSAKQPWLIRMADDQPFALAGLWDAWQDELQSFSILTTQANSMLKSIHDRMPVVVDANDYERWLAPAITDPQAVADILRPLPSELMYAVAVSTYVNNARHDGPQCMQPVDRLF